MAKKENKITGFKTEMTLDRETKGTYVYATTDEDAKNASIRSLYISRSAFSGDAPKKITVDVSEA